MKTIKSKTNWLRAKELAKLGVNCTGLSKEFGVSKETITVWFRENKTTITKERCKYLKPLFVKSFASGKVKLTEFSKANNISRVTLHNWKREHFGYGSQKQKQAFKMFLVGISINDIAEFFNVPTQQIDRYVREGKDKQGVQRKTIKSVV